MMNYVFNQLEINCYCEANLAFVKELIFKTNEKGNQIFTMGKFMPKPVTDNQAYIEDWCRSVWGTQNDVHDCIISQDRDCLSIQYVTDWHSNRNWVDNFIRYLNNWCLSTRIKSDCLCLILQYKCFELALNKGSLVFWTKGETWEKENTYKSLNEFVGCLDFDTSYDLFTKKKEFRANYGKYIYYESDISRFERNLPVDIENRRAEGDELPF